MNIFAVFGSLDAFNILSYGVIGLGFLLAYLAYRLLGREQSNAIPRRSILIAIYVFMVFSVCLCIIGFGSENLRNRPTAAVANEIKALHDQLDQKQDEANTISAINNQLTLTLQKYRDRQRESSQKNKKIIENLKNLANLPFVPEKYRHFLVEASDSLQQPIVSED